MKFPRPTHQPVETKFIIITQTTVYLVHLVIPFLFLIKAPLGSIPELPAHSCLEIKVSEGKIPISNKYWLDPTRNGPAVLLHCDMDLKGFWQSPFMSVVYNVLR